MYIEHFNICAPHELLQKVKEFYCFIFDLKEGFRPNFESKGYWLYSGENALVHLTESDKHYSSDMPFYLDHITFQSTGLNTLLEKLIRLKVEYTTDQLGEIGMTQIFFKDPAGVGLEVNFLDEELHP